MTLVEFFDRDSLENICSCAAARADRVILIGGDRQTAERCIAGYRKIFAARQTDVAFEYVSVDRRRLSRMTQTITRIVQAYPDCVFDLTGGDDLCLVAVGMVFAKNPRLRLHRFSLQNDRIYEFDAEGDVHAESAAPQLTVDEVVQAYGGDVCFDSETTDGTHIWDLNDDFRRDILTMSDFLWGRNAAQWNRQISYFKMMHEVGASADPLRVSAELNAIRALSGSKQYEGAALIPEVTEPLEQAGLAAVSVSENAVTVAFKNRQIMRCLIKEGQALELVVYLLAKQAQRDGAPVYNDVQTGVYIDWDGALKGGGETDVHNEIDVMMTRGMIPVFVSCKNGAVDIDELYKLDAVATRFGGKYAKRVLVATSLRFRSNRDAIRQRATEMQIHLVEPGNLDELRREIASAYTLNPVV